MDICLLFLKFSQKGKENRGGGGTISFFIFSVLLFLEAQIPQQNTFRDILILLEFAGQRADSTVLVVSSTRNGVNRPLDLKLDFCYYILIMQVTWHVSHAIRGF